MKTPSHPFLPVPGFLPNLPHRYNCFFSLCAPPEVFMHRQAKINIYSYLSPLNPKGSDNKRYSKYTVLYLAFLYSWCIFLKKILFICRERGREGEKEGEKHWCVRDTLISCLLHTPTGDLACNPAHALTGNWMATFWFTGQCSIHWATPARACDVCCRMFQREKFLFLSIITSFTAA